MTSILALDQGTTGSRALVLHQDGSIVWQDRRTANRCTELRRDGLESLVRERTGLVLDPYFSATKLEWLLRDAELRRRAERGELAAGTVVAWLVAKLTRGARQVTDPT